MDFDYTWKNPTEPQLVALEYAYRAIGQKPPELTPPITHHFLVTQAALGRSLAVDAGIYRGSAFQLSPYDAAELILQAEDSLWFVQAKSWAEKPPKNCPPTWQLACKFIVSVVGLGYDEENKRWWNLDKLSSVKVGLGNILLLDFKQMLAQYRQQSLDVVSSGFDLFIDLICNKKYMAEIRKEYRDALPYKTTKCIKPDCNNLVAPVGVEPHEGDCRNYRATGACEKGHNIFWCLECKKPHSYVSGVGKEHLKYIQQEAIP